MPGAMDIWHSVQHLRPLILTGLPRGEWAELQKRAWVRQHFGEGVKVICCMAYDKPRYARRGDILLDDSPQAQAGWEGVGGVFVLYTSAPTAIVALKKIKQLFPPSQEEKLGSSNDQPKRQCRVSPIACVNYQKGHCWYGDKCRFSHALQIASPQEMLQKTTTICSNDSSSTTMTSVTSTSTAPPDTPIAGSIATTTAATSTLTKPAPEVITISDDEDGPSVNGATCASDEASQESGVWL